MAGIVGAILFLLVMLTIFVFLFTLNMRRSLPNGKPSSFKPHYSVTYHASSASRKLQMEVELSEDDALSSDETHGKEKTSSNIQMDVDISEDILHCETQNKEKKTAETSASSLSAPSIDDESQKPNSVDELVPVRPAPQRPPARKPPPAPVPKPRNSPYQSQSTSTDRHQDASKLEQKEASAVTIGDNLETSVHPDNQIVAQKTVPVETPSGSKSCLPSTSVEQHQPESSKEETSTTETDKQLPLPGTVNKVGPPKPQLRPAPMAPPKAEKPSAPAKQNVPQPASKPTPASKPVPAAKPGSMQPSDMNEGANAPAPIPDGQRPPKPAVKPTGLDSKTQAGKSLVFVKLTS